MGYSFDALIAGISWYLFLYKFHVSLVVITIRAKRLS